VTKTVLKTSSPAAIGAIDVVAIVGPTGSGKSALALHVAREFHGEIVNCDSVQLFRGFDIGTAKLPPSERHQVPHHLIDVLQPGDGYSAGDYARDARATIAAISARAALPVIAGGTGFYLRALLNGLPNLPGRDDRLRSDLAAREAQRPGTVHRLLTRLDPAAARRIHSRDLQKSTRALEIRVLTRAVSPTPAAELPPGYRVLKIGLNPDRARLYQTLDARAREMFQSGRLLDEVRALLAHGATGGEKPFESLGYKQALQHIHGSLSLPQAIESTQLETRQYAKRQWTWFRREPDVVWLEGFGNAPRVIEEAVELVRRFV
jgi:tRNA dimethylallyltransferase